MTVARETKLCPFCCEAINARAQRCRHCQADLTATKSKGSKWFIPYNNFRSGFVTGIMFSLVLAGLIYAHLNW